MDPESIHSYRRFMREHLFDLVDLDPARCHVPPGDIPRGEIAAACRGYEASIRAAGGIDIQLLEHAALRKSCGGAHATGRGLTEWQAETGAPLLPLDQATGLVIDADRDWLADRIDRRFAAMVAGGALDEVRSALPLWDPAALWARAIGAPELVAHLRGELTLEAATLRAQAASRQYAKRQRSWFRARMRGWRRIAAP